MSYEFITLPSVVEKNSLNYYEDELSYQARNAHTDHLLGPWLISRAAQADGAKIEWLSRAMFIASINGLEILFWDTRSNELSVGAKIATNKGHTHRFMRRAGVAAPKYKVVTSVERAQAFWKNLKKPIVVKPLKGTRGHGITLGANTEEEVEQAFFKANTSAGVLIEEQVYGEEFRFLVVGDKTVAVLGKRSAHVIGDGLKTIMQLIDEKNAIRSLNPRLMTSLVTVDEVVERNLSRQKLSLDSVPENGAYVTLKTEANISQGADTYDATDFVSEKSKSIAVAAVRAIPGLDIAGVDIMLSEPSSNNGDVNVIEVNTCPGIGGHHFPMEGMPRDVALAVWEQAYKKQMAIDGKGGNLSNAKDKFKRVVLEVSGEFSSVNFIKWFAQEVSLTSVEGWVRGIVASNSIQVALHGSSREVQSLIGKLALTPGLIDASVSDMKVRKHFNKLRRSGFVILKDLNS